jgi:hypothetical protein
MPDHYTKQKEKKQIEASVKIKTFYRENRLQNESEFPSQKIIDSGQIDI